jgi:hypothetical protein
MAFGLRTALHTLANGWKEKNIEDGINLAVTRLSLSEIEIQQRGKHK